MKTKYLLALVILFLGLFILASGSFADLPERKIVVFRPDVSLTDRVGVISQYQGKFNKHLGLVNGVAANIPSRRLEELIADPRVLRVDDDVEVFALARSPRWSGLARPQPAESLPWGIERIKANLVWGQTTGDSARVGIIDTGIDVKHLDLKENLKGGVSTVWYTASYNDDNGHGTHVAGTVGAIDNEIGVIGVGPKIDLYAIKVLDRRGSGYLSDVLEGLDWAIANGMQVLNMSLGTSSDVGSFREAVERVAAAGIVQVAAAGNTGGTVIYPAAYTEVIAVSATDKENNLASFSSRGPQIDLAAPGVDIYSTYKGQTYKTLRGTSMAAPHVSGTVGLLLTVPVGNYDLDGDNAWDPLEVKNRLEATADDLGEPGWDELYGAGLVNALKAVTAP